MGSVFGVLSYTDVILLAVVVVFVAHRLWVRRQNQQRLAAAKSVFKLPPLRRQDMTLQQLHEFDGSRKDGRICLAVGGKIFDVTSTGHLYGKDGPYGIFAGNDASRGLALMQTDDSVIKEVYDDLSDLSSVDLDNLVEWSAQFREKYPVVGRLLKPGEEPDVYSDEEIAKEEGDSGNSAVVGATDTAASSLSASAPSTKED